MEAPGSLSDPRACAPGPHPLAQKGIQPGGESEVARARGAVQMQDGPQIQAARAGADARDQGDPSTMPGSARSRSETDALLQQATGLC